MYNVIKTGSKGNCVIYHKSIMVDCGVPFKEVKPFIKDLEIILLTHSHGDHINVSTIKRIQKERPAVRVAFCDWMLSEVCELKNLDLLEIGNVYNYQHFEIEPIKLYHDVPNCGYRIFKDKKKILHATDTGHLEGIAAKEYDLYAIESNFDEEKADEAIKEAERAGIYCHANRSTTTHLSHQQCFDFYEENKGENSKLIKLHKSETFG